MTAAGKKRLQELLQEKHERGDGTWDHLGPTIRAYASGAIPSKPYPRTLKMIDGKMGWTDGSARSVLEGGEPISLDQPAISGSVRERLKVLGEQLRDVADQLVRELERLE